jgi:hypothetical protein
LWVLATDAVGNTSSASVAFTIDAFLGVAPQPQAATFASSSGKVKKGKFKAAVKVRILPPDGAQLSKACSGSVIVTVIGKVGKKSKTYSKKTDMQIAADRCAVTTTFTLPKKLKGKKLKAKASFGGNAEMGAFRFNGSIKKA